MSIPPNSHPGPGAAPDSLAALAGELQQHLALCQQILALVQHEHQQLKAGAVEDLFALQESRQAVLERLPLAQEAVLAHKEEWTRLTSAERKKRPEIANLLKQSTDLILKIVALDRENEQLMLRLKLVPPSHMPPAERQNPSLVAKLYKDQP